MSEGITYLCRQTLQKFLVQEKISHDSGQSGGCRFTTCDDQNAECLFDFRNCHAFFVVVAENIGHEVVSLSISYLALV